MDWSSITPFSGKPRVVLTIMQRFGVEVGGCSQKDGKIQHSSRIVQNQNGLFEIFLDLFEPFTPISKTYVAPNISVRLIRKRLNYYILVKRPASVYQFPLSRVFSAHG